MNRKFPGLNRAKLDSVQSSLVAEVMPQASDDAFNADTISLWGLFLSIFGYIAYAVYKDLNHDWPTIAEMRAARLAQTDILRVTPQDVPMRTSSPTTVRDFPGLRFEARSDSSESKRENIEPQSENLPMMQMQDDTQAQNVSFKDTHPGFGQSVPSTIDSVRDAALNSDATLDEFFSRPIRIQTIDWVPGQPTGGLCYAKFNPWQLYFENLRVINRISNYKLLRAKLCLKFTINGTPFHYGRVICSYNPLPNDDTMTIDRAFIGADNIAASQRPHVYLDPTNSQGATMCLPFFTPENLLDVPGMGWRNMGELVVNSLTGLKHANGGTDLIVINVFSRVEDVKYAIPTQDEPGAISPQAGMGGMDEYQKKPVSRIAGAVANFASYLVDVPVIGPFARATDIGARAVGSIATLFGYSAPARLDMSLYRPVTNTNYALTNMPSDALKVSLDAKQELSVDPRTVGLDGQDEMELKYIAGRESYLTSFPWAIGGPPESILWNSVVDPCIHFFNNNEIHMPASCFATTPFKYWRGTMRFRFQFVASKFHKGRVKIVYDPSGNTTGTAEYNTAYTTIVDISDNADFAIEVGWGQAQPYREHAPIPSALNTLFQPALALTYSSPTQTYGNGTLAVYVVNELSSPATTVNNDIEVNVFVSMSDDFEVAVPDMRTVETLRVTASGIVEPQAEEGGMSDETMKVESQPAIETPVDTLANYIPVAQDPTNLIYFGETIKSFRSLCKRFSRHELISGEGTIGMIQRQISRNNFPHWGGYTAASPSAFRVTYPLAAGYYAYACTTILNYVTCAYGGWRGGTRVVYDMTDHSYSYPRTAGVTRISEGVIPTEGFAAAGANAWLASTKGDMMNDTAIDVKGNGAMFQSTDNSPLLLAELPYYSNQRFVPAKRLSDFTQGDPLVESHLLTVNGFNGGSENRGYIRSSWAGAEDFTTFFFLGAPIFYVEPTVPTA